MFAELSRSLLRSRKALQLATKLSRTRSTVANPLQSTVNSPATNLTTIENGVRVATEDSGLPTATVGVWIEAGSRYEKSNVNGVAHFMEHMAFKGTEKRTQSQLEMEIEDMGAQLNAYTSREQTVFYCKCLSKDVPQAMDILADILKNSKLGESEIERERAVILREMQEIESNLQEVVFDYLHLTAYQQTPLANTILGPSENIRRISQRDLREYLEENYKASRIVIAGAGGVKHDELVDLARKHFGKISNTYPGEIPMVHACRYTGSEVEARDDALPLAHVAFAVEGASWTNPDVYALMVASTILGSWDRSQANAKQHSNELVRISHKEGLCHQFQSFNTCYQDTGLWGVYFSSERMTAGDMLYYVQREMIRLCQDVRESEVERAKSQLIANSLLQLDSTSAICEDIGRQMLTYGRRISPQEMIYRIQSLTTEEIKRVCYNYLYDQCPVLASVGPTEALPDYALIRSQMYWYRV